MNTTLKALVQRIWRRAYLDTEEECARWIEEYIQSEQLHKPDVSGSLPPQVKFELQKIALADDEMVLNAGAAVTYRDMIRKILKVYGGNDR